MAAKKKKLTSIDLSISNMTDAAAKVILKNKSAFVHLESINLSGNELSESICEELEETFDLAVDVEEQGSYTPIVE